ncbi:MAG: hypothetical protein AAGA48_10130 [Myxococcota bacterium]
MKAASFWLICALVPLSLGGLTSCSDPSEAPRVLLPVVVDASGVAPVTSDLGYEVNVTEVRIAIRDVVFTVAGEVHLASVWQAISNTLIPSAFAHPGHAQNGDVTGEMRGEYVVNWPTDDGRELGTATLIAGTYSASNFTFGRGSAEHLDAEDPLVGHTAIISGTATKNGLTMPFTIVVDSPEGRELIGAPFEATIDENATGTLNLQFNTLDATEGDTVFDGVDFATLTADGVGVVVIEPNRVEVEDAYNTFRRVFQTHDHFNLEHRESP